MACARQGGRRALRAQGKGNMHPAYILKGTKIKREREPGLPRVFGCAEVCRTGAVSSEGCWRIYKGECSRDDYFCR